MNKATRTFSLMTLIIISASLLASASALAAKPSKPNIVFILVDDLGWADIGAYGSSFYETPNVDKLARSGVMFTDGYAACPVCSPSRAAILSGKTPTSAAAPLKSKFLSVIEDPDPWAHDTEPVFWTD